jgi:NAD(P)-dependent dehydrogenase (short-subunit alcohol dehydrogenase family)
VSEVAHVFTTGRREAELRAALKDIGTNVTGVQGDVSKLADLDRLIAQIQRDFARVLGSPRRSSHPQAASEVWSEVRLR